MFEKEFIPYGKHKISKDDIQSVIDVLKSDFLTQGPKIKEFEDKVAHKVGSKYAISSNSATSALHIACLALGLSKNDILWTSSITFVASANVGRYCGAKVDFVEIDFNTGLISINALTEKLEIAKKNNKLPKIFIPVHLAGSSCDMEEIYKLSLIYKFKIVEDASHAIGASYKEFNVGECKFSDITIFSLHPVKIITSGEGGIATTNDKHLYDQMKLLVSHGIEKNLSNFCESTNDEIWNYQQLKLGFNYRMTDIQAALGLSQLRNLRKFVEIRNSIASIYNRELEDLTFKLPYVKSHNISSYHLYVIRIPFRNNYYSQKYFFNSLKKANILVNLHYIPVYRQPYYKELGFKKGYCPEAELYFKEIITLPIFPTLKDEQQKYIIEKLKELDLKNG